MNGTESLRPKSPACDDCQSLDCHSIHGSVPESNECLLDDCYICAELEQVDQDIARTYKRLAKYVEKRRNILAKPRHDPVIHRMPAEILSSVFLFVKDAILHERSSNKDSKEDVVEWPKTSTKQPSRSPPLLLGSVCMRWNEIALTTPRLWTDIIVNLDKCADGQFNMIKKWARRSGRLSLDIFIYQQNLSLVDHNNPEDCYEDILLVLRSLVVRWRDIGLRVYGSFFLALFNNIQEASYIRTLSLPAVTTTSYQNRSLQAFQQCHPLRARHLMLSMMWSCHVKDLPVEWDRLVFLETKEVKHKEILHIIRHATNLQRCVAFDIGRPYDGELLATPITNYSLTHLFTNLDILGHLTLPSLLVLQYAFFGHREEDVEDIVNFLIRSSPPLSSFTLSCPFSTTESSPRLDFFEKLPSVTSIHLEDERIEEFLDMLTQCPPDTFLPRLRECSFEAPYTSLSFSAWSLLSRLLVEDPTDLENAPNASIHSRRPIAKVSVQLTDVNRLEMSLIGRDSFLRLWEAKKSGVDLTLNDETMCLDLFSRMASQHEVEL